jgi:formylglycine-generating enzyme required for sulfatase activity
MRLRIVVLAALLAACAGDPRFSGPGPDFTPRPGETAVERYQRFLRDLAEKGPGSDSRQTHERLSTLREAARLDQPEGLRHRWALLDFLANTPRPERGFFGNVGAVFGIASSEITEWETRRRQLVQAAQAEQILADEMLERTKIDLAARNTEDRIADRQAPKKTRDYIIPFHGQIQEWIQQKRDTNFNMVKIPAGRYKLGDNTFKGNRERIYNLEKAFWIDRFEVTNADWWHFLWATKDSREYFAAPPIVMGDFDADKWVQGHEYFKYDYERAKHPIRAISFEEAKMFARFVRKRLPTADEWEIAARGPQGYRYPWGDKYTKADWKTKAQTSFMMSMEATGGADRNSIVWLKDTVPVDKLSDGQSPFGCYNMADNVSEWTTTDVPVGHSEWKKVRKSERPLAKVVKGGSFFSRQKGALAAQFFEVIADAATDQFRIGFRCVRDD